MQFISEFQVHTIFLIAFELKIEMFNIQVRYIFRTNFDICSKI